MGRILEEVLGAVCTYYTQNFKRPNKFIRKQIKTKYILIFRMFILQPVFASLTCLRKCVNSISNIFCKFFCLSDKKVFQGKGGMFDE